MARAVRSDIWLRERLYAWVLPARARREAMSVPGAGWGAVRAK
jgi:hypothetical protein